MKARRNTAAAADLQLSMGKKPARIAQIPVQTESIKMRSALMTALKHHIERIGLSQAMAAKALGVTQPRISDLMRGKITLFSLDTLVEMAAAAGLQVNIQVTGARSNSSSSPCSSSSPPFSRRSLLP